MKIQTNLKLVKYSSDLDLSEFYAEAGRRGFENNSSQKVMIDPFKKEREWNAWFVYHGNTVCGGVVCHTLDIMGPKAYRICARNCFFSEYNPNKGLYTKRSMINQHQNSAPQLYIPASVEWAGWDKEYYITSNNSPVASQRLVHKLWCPEMARMGMMTKVHELEYRGHIQSFWRVYVDKIIEDLNNCPKWLLQPS